MKKNWTKLLDLYFKHPFIVDFTFIVISLLAIYIFKDKIHPIKGDDKINDVIGNLISSIVSLAGFILASLTIIVTVKSNIKIRSLEHAENGLELILASDNYKTIVSTFRDSIIELTFALAMIYLWWSPIFHLSKLKYIMLIAFGILIIVFTLTRTLSILFKLIFLEFNKKEISC